MTALEVEASPCCELNVVTEDDRLNVADTLVVEDITTDDMVSLRDDETAC